MSRTRRRLVLMMTRDIKLIMRIFFVRTTSIGRRERRIIMQLGGHERLGGLKRTRLRCEWLTWRERTED